MKIKALNLTSNAVSGALSYRADQGWDITMTNGGFTVIRGDLGFFFSGSKCDAVLDLSQDAADEPEAGTTRGRADELNEIAELSDDPEPAEERMSNLPPATRGRRRGPRGPKK